jgi:hypothetical protein
MYQSIVIEGGDQIGKGDATQYLCKKLYEENIKVYRLSFPLYASPIGFSIRCFLKNDVRNIPSLKDVVGTKRELEIKMVMYALNRLEAVESILRSSKIKEGILVFDRSPYSNALTLAYGLGGLKNVTLPEVDELIDLGLELEKYMIDILSLKNCVIHLVADTGKEGWNLSRVDENDLYEQKDVQKVADIVYDMIGQKVGDGWKKVYTKIDGKWRDRGDIYKDIRGFVDSRVDLNTSKSKEEPVLIDILDVSKDIFNLDISHIDGVNEYLNAISECDKGTIYEKSREISTYICKNMVDIDIQSSDVLNQFRNILEKYPECIDILNHFLPNEYGDKLSKYVFGK